eukprot:CAMPEP_0172434476 /NCGR_PEP_ID=MMETSP1064-20121228/70650_1 /TAXON_ID=202472 /ORGANISM="Aulacoseira subarctica , Strain CCAP 1002/5" /LENGTH=399 /DNA_ID=CAMNT_0013182703 /DNA_START=1909 /DNA_END=3109 /DNA_ORIENTATION=-
MDENLDQADTEEARFLLVLTDIVRLTAPQANFIINQDITNARQLVRFDDTIMNEMFARPTLVNTTAMTKMRFRAFRQWVKEQVNANIQVDSLNFTMEECERQQDIMSIMTSTTEKYKTNGKDTNKEPEKFNGKPTKWKQWKNEFEGHLSQITGSSGDTPLVYITRDDDEITEDEYNELEGPMKKVYDAPLQGYHFDKDNYLVFQKLRNQLSGGLAETHLSDFERSGNGHAAWQHLVTCFEGEDAKNAAITAARNDIREATWEKNTRNWTFDMYCLKHVKAHNTLRKYGIIIEGETKVRDFIRGIHNQSLASIKANILLTDRTKNDLDQAIIAFKDTISVLQLTNASKEPNEDRRIGSVQRDGRGITRGGNRNQGRGQNQTGSFRSALGPNCPILPSNVG